MEKNKITKNEQGITLIALVITIIVLLILAGVSIAMLTGDNGILTQASKSKEATEQGKVEEMVSVAIGGLRAEYLGDKDQITPQKIAEQVNKDNNRTDVTASSTTFPTNIEFEEEGLKVPVDINLNIGNSETNKPEELPLYSADIDESQIAPTELFDFEIIQETASNTKVATTGNISGLPQKEARITRIKPEYCNGAGYNPDKNENDLEDTNYEIIYGGITDTLIIPYQVEIDGEMYRITEVNLTVQGKTDYSSGQSLPSIENIIYPNTVKNIVGYNSFVIFEHRLKNIVLSKSLTQIPNDFFYRLEIEKIEIPLSVTNIGNSAFENCSELNEINIPPRVTNIGNSAFEGCTALKKINIPSSVTSVGENTFRACTKLAEINISLGVTSIGERAFMNCYNLININIPSSVTNIDEYTFLGCNSLKNINIAKPENSIEGAPWQAPETTKINWNYQEK